MATAFVSLGSNIEPEKNVREAVRRLSSQAKVMAISTVYLTEAIGPPGQPVYYNCVIRLETEVLPLVLKQNVLRPIEASLGRKRTADKFAPRTIDLDLILYDAVIMHSDELTLPDPDIARRSFLIACLSELVPDLVLPGSKTTISNLAEGVKASPMTALRDYTERLKGELLNAS